MEYRVINRKLLIVEDEPALRDEIAAHFSARNRVLTATEADEALALLRREPEIDAVILDLILKRSMGLDLFQTETALPPVVILSTLDGDEQILTGLTAGAADYIVKPCSMKLLETRVAMRLLPKRDAVRAFGDFSVDANLRMVRYRNEPLALTSSEFNVLYFLVTHAGDFFSADEIYEQVWGAPSLQNLTVRRHLSSLRRKLKAVAPEADLIRTEFGRGYAFLPPSARTGMRGRP